MEDVKAGEASEKKRRTRRIIITILIVVIDIIAVIGIWFLSRYQHTSSDRPESLYTGSIEQFHSSVDKDGDGIDDQVDIWKAHSSMSIRIRSTRASIIIPVTRMTGMASVRM